MGAEGGVVGGEVDGVDMGTSKWKERKRKRDGAIV